MRIIGLAVAEKFCAKNNRAKAPFERWKFIVEAARWLKPADVKCTDRTVSIVKDSYIFNIGSNKYRLSCRINFEANMVRIYAFETHADYDKRIHKK